MTGRCRIRPDCPVLAQVVFLFFLLGLISAAGAQNEESEPIAAALQNQEFQKALELVRPALQASPGNAQLWAMQGAAYSGEGHAKEALASFRKSLKISADYLPALEGAIQIEYEAGDPAA